LKIRTRWPPSSSPEEAETLPEEGRFCSIFFEGGGTLFLLGVLAKTGGWMWFFGGEGNIGLLR
jgi:hypothetical protein